MTYKEWLATESIRIQAQDMAQQISRLDPFQLQSPCWKYHYLSEIKTEYPTANDLINGLCRLGVL